MPTEQDFLEVIQANPDDDVSKLVYADWLDEQGDPRGELIRLVVEVDDLEGEQITHRHWGEFVNVVEAIFGTWRLHYMITLLDECQQRLFACQCAESIESYYEEYFPHDARVRNAITVARAYANGAATDQEMWKARDSAAEAARETNAQPDCHVAKSVSPAANAAAHCLEDDTLSAAFKAATEAAGPFGPARNQLRIWLVERLLGFKTD